MRLSATILLLIVLSTANAQSLTIGLEEYDPPFSMQIDTPKKLFTGFEAQLIAEICQRLQADCHYIPLQFKDFFTWITAKKIDLAIGQISITLPREAQFSFSLPYLISHGRFITLPSSAIKTVSDINGKRVGIFKSSLYKSYLTNQFNKITILEYDSTPDAFNALLNGNIDVLLLARIAENYWIANSRFQTSDFNYIGDPIPLGNGYGIMANLQSHDLITAINKILLQMESDGSYLQLYNLYFGSIQF